MTTVSPGLILPPVTAANASSSRLKTRAGPRCVVGVCCVTLTTEPSGASEPRRTTRPRSEEHTSELQSRGHLVCRLLLEKKKNKIQKITRQRQNKAYTTPT